MIHPADSEIPARKAVEYLLIRQARGDKSGYLARAGYTTQNAARLIEDIRTQLLPLDAQPVKINEYGQYCQVSGVLRGPNGRELPVRAIWMTEHLSGATVFVTLVPDSRRQP